MGRRQVCVLQRKAADGPSKRSGRSPSTETLRKEGFPNPHGRAGCFIPPHRQVLLTPTRLLTLVPSSPQAHPHAALGSSYRTRGFIACQLLGSLIGIFLDCLLNPF